MSYKAFVSSTFEDLSEHRKKVLGFLRKAGIFVDPMEDWTAASDEPKKFSQDRIKDCDFCVLLVAFRRGHVPQDETSSITQLEYQAAVELGIDVLVFMLEEESPWPHKFHELDKDPEIRPWRAELKEHRGIGFFGLEPSSIEIAPALARWIGEREKQEVAAESSPAWNVPDRNPFFTGRKNVLKELHAQLESDGAVVFTGIGGLGKSQTAIEYAHLHRDDY